MKPIKFAVAYSHFLMLLSSFFETKQRRAPPRQTIPSGGSLVCFKKMKNTEIADAIVSFNTFAVNAFFEKNTEIAFCCPAAFYSSGAFPLTYQENHQMYHLLKLKN